MATDVLGTPEETFRLMSDGCSNCSIVDLRPRKQAEKQTLQRKRGQGYEVRTECCHRRNASDSELCGTKRKAGANARVSGIALRIKRCPSTPAGRCNHLPT